MKSPQTHPSLKALAATGRLDLIANVVEQEHRQGLPLGGWRLGERYLLRSGLLALDVHPLDDLLWVYVQVTKKKAYYVIPAGQSTALLLKWRDASVKIDLKEELAAEAAQAIGATHPWVVFGWNEQVQALYNRQRASFVVQVRKQREAWRQEQAQQRAELPTEPAALMPA